MRFARAMEPARPSLIETNLSWVFLTPDRAYKLLRPVELPFVDHRDRPTRIDAVRAEFEVNRSFSPDVYLDLVDLHGADGDVEDRMIVMRRLDDADALTERRTPEDLDAALRSVARRIAGIHASLEALDGDDAAPASIAAVTANWEDNLRVIERHGDTVIPGTEVEQAAQLFRNYLAGREALFEQRAAEGWIRRGHGDLRCEHVFVEGNDVQLLDALAFGGDRYRVADVLADIAFLAMDLDRLHGPEASVALMQYWGEFTNEHHASSLAHFLVAYRAHVRTKVALLRFESGDALAAGEAREYHRLALRHLEHARPRLVLVGGGPGTGKSTVAEGLARRIGAMWLRADELRKDLAGLGHEDHAFAPPEEGIYAEEMTARVNRELARRAQLLLSRGESVVLDATWKSDEHRRLLRETGNEWFAEVDELHCQAPAPIAKERIARRMSMVHNPSDASPELVDYIEGRFDDWPEARPIDTNQPIAESLKEAVDAVTGRPSNTSHQHERFFLDVPAVKRLTGIWLLHEGLAPIATDP